jgi:hypothetical protein
MGPLYGPWRSSLHRLDNGARYSLYLVTRMAAIIPPGFNAAIVCAPRRVCRASGDLGV